MGGAIAQLVAIDYPDRIASLTLIAADSGNPELPVVADSEAFAEVPPSPPSPDEREARIDYQVEVSKALAGFGYPMDDATRRDAAERGIERFFNPEAAARQEVISFVGHIESADYRFDNLRRIEAPTVVLHGAEDPLVATESANDIAVRVPDAELRIGRGLGHEVPAGAADEFVEAIVSGATGI